MRVLLNNPRTTGTCALDETCINDTSKEKQLITLHFDWNKRKPDIS
jgi:hypothetical protein